MERTLRSLFKTFVLFCFLIGAPWLGVNTLSKSIQNDLKEALLASNLDYDESMCLLYCSFKLKKPLVVVNYDYIKPIIDQSGIIFNIVIYGLVCMGIGYFIEYLKHHK